MEKIRRDRKAILVFLLPGLLVYTILLILPIGGSLVLGFFKWNGIRGSEMTFVGIENFVAVFQDPSFWHSMKNILWFLVLTLFTQLPIGLLLAVLLSEQFRGYKFFKAAYFIPQVVSTTVVGLIWYFILMPVGVLNEILDFLGLRMLIHNWLVEPSTAMTSLILINTWCGIGFHMATSYAAIQALPSDVIEAGVLDGCTGLKKVRYMIVPMIWQSIVSSIVIIVTAVLKTFDLVYVMTSGGPNGLTDVPSTLLYKQAFKYSNFGRASAIGVILFVLSILCTILSLRITKREVIEY